MRYMRCPKCGDIVEQELNMNTLDYDKCECQNCKIDRYEISREDVSAFQQQRINLNVT